MGTGQGPEDEVVSTKEDPAFLERYKAARARLRNPPAPSRPGTPIDPAAPSRQASHAKYDPAFQRARNALAAMPAAVARRIQKEVCAKTGIRLEDMLSARRGNGIATARQEAMWRIHRETTLTLTAIGRLFDRDHATVLWAIRKLDQAAKRSGKGRAKCCRPIAETSIAASEQGK